MHLLVIEDNPDLVANIVDFLEERGHTLDIAYNGFAGLGFTLETDSSSAPSSAKPIATCPCLC